MEIAGRDFRCRSGETVGEVCARVSGLSYFSFFKCEWGQEALFQFTLHCRDRFGVPDVLGILPDGAVGGELAHARDVEDGLARPRLRIAPQVADLRLAIHIRLKIRK